MCHSEAAICLVYVKIILSPLTIVFMIVQKTFDFNMNDAVTLKIMIMFFNAN